MNKHTIETEIIESGEQRGGSGRRITAATLRAEYMEAYRSDLTHAN